MSSMWHVTNCLLFNDHAFQPQELYTDIDEDAPPDMDSDEEECDSENGEGAKPIMALPVEPTGELVPEDDDVEVLGTHHEPRSKVESIQRRILELKAEMANSYDAMDVHKNLAYYYKRHPDQRPKTGPCSVVGIHPLPDPFAKKWPTESSTKASSEKIAALRERIAELKLKSQKTPREPKWPD